MLIKRKSLLSGKSSTMDLPVNKKQLEDWQNGMLIQEVMPNLNSEQREFLISGMSVKEQNQFFK